MLQNEIVQFRCGFDNVNLFLAKFFLLAVILLHRSYIKERKKPPRGWLLGAIKKEESTIIAQLLQVAL